MAALQRHWKSTVVLSICAVLLATWGWRASTQQAAVAQEDQQDYTAMSNVQRDTVRSVLSDLHLDHGALVALNLSAAQAEAVLDAARTWCEDNAATLETLQNTIDTKVAAVREIDKAIAVGPLNGEHATQLATARSELATAQASYASTISALGSNINVELSASQVSTLSAIASGHNLGMPIRMLALTDTQRLDVSAAWKKYRRTYVAADQEGRATAVATWHSDLDGVLTAAQETVYDAYPGYAESSGENVAAAIDAVLLVSDG